MLIGYPETLEMLVDGVRVTGQPGGGATAAGAGGFGGVMGPQQQGIRRRAWAAFRKPERQRREKGTVSPADAEGSVYQLDRVG
jgi:hypothetical protein